MPLLVDWIKTLIGRVSLRIADLALLLAETAITRIGEKKTP